jgi:hypothetical protein
MRRVGIVVVLAFAVVFAANAAVMLVSPRAWFRIPRWLGSQGSTTMKEYGSGWGAIQVRLTGALFLAGMGWVLYDLFVKH